MARPTVAVGDPVLKGSAILWDNLTGLSTTDAHVILQCSTAAGALDPEMQGVALGVGSADADIVWLWTARIVTISYPPSPRPSWLAKIASWSFTIAPGSPTLDLAVLQVQGPLNGGPSKPLNEMFADHGLDALPLGYSGLAPAGLAVRVYGFGQSSSHLTRRAMITSGIISRKTDQTITIDVAMLGGHSGGMLLEPAGKVIGWCVWSQTDAVIGEHAAGLSTPSGVNDLRPINLLRPALEAALLAIDPSRTGVTLMEKLRGAVPFLPVQHQPPPPPPPRPFLDDVPNLPEQYVSRPVLEAAHRDALLRTTHTMAITATTTGVSGGPGAGKSVVLARDPLVHAHFPDGVTWLEFGRERTGADVLRTLATSILRLDPALPHEQLPGAISAAFVGQRQLLVLDDIWTKEQLQAFASLAAEGGLLGRLVTTRSNELAGEHAQTVEALQAEEGLRVFAGYVGTAVEQLNDDADKLVDMCSGNPAMLRSVAAFCKKKGAAYTRTYLEECRQKMRHAKLPDAGEQYGTLFDALTGSLDHLRPGLAKRCAMLATFPEDTDVPWSVVGQLWGTDALETEEAVTELESWHLIDVEWDKCALSLIDLHLDYLRVRAKDDLARWHAALLRGCGRRKLGTDEGTADDAYWGRSCGGLPSSSGQHHLHHLRGCGWEPTALGGELTHLAFGGGQRLGDECVKALSEAIKVSGSLTTLWLNSNHLGPEGGVALAEALKVNRSLTDMDISGNPICEHNEVEGTYSVDGINAVCDALRVSGPLTSLNLGHCGIGAEGGVAVAEALRGNSSLTRLSLHANCIGTQVGVAIAEALKVNGSLTYLNIHSNDTIGDTGAGGPGCQRLVEVAGFAIWP